MAATTSKAKAVSLYIRFRSTDGSWLAPPKLRAKLVSEAKRDGTNLHDVAVRILSDRFGVAFVPSARHTTPKKTREELNLRVSVGLRRKIAAAAEPRSAQKLAIEVLAEHYGLAMPNGKRAH